MYSSDCDCGAYRQEPSGEVCFVWNGVKIEWHVFIKRVHALKIACQIAAVAPCDHEGYCYHKVCQRALDFTDEPCQPT